LPCEQGFFAHLQIAPADKATVGNGSGTIKVFLCRRDQGLLGCYLRLQLHHFGNQAGALRRKLCALRLGSGKCGIGLRREAGVLSVYGGLHERGGRLRRCAILFGADRGQ
jgi:hypothetical protein